MQAMIRIGIRVLLNIRDYAMQLAVTTPFGEVAKQAQLLAEVVKRLMTVAAEQPMNNGYYRLWVANSHALTRRLKQAFLQPLIELLEIVAPDEPVIKLGDARTFDGLVVLATNLAERAEREKEKLMALGLNEDFAVRLRAAVVELQQARATSAEHFVARAKCTAAIKDEYKRARKIVRILDSILESEFANSPEKLAEWRTVSHFERRTVNGRPADGGTTVPTSTPASETQVADGGNTPPAGHVA